MKSLNDIYKEINYTHDELHSFLAVTQSVFDRMKIVIGNDLGCCRRNECTVEKPCIVCKELRQLDKDIDKLLSNDKEENK